MTGPEPRPTRPVDAPRWLADWPRCHPRPTGPWTLARPGGWARLEPERGRVSPAVPTRDRRLPGLATALADGGRLVAYRVGRRAVLADGDRWIKVVRPARRARLVEVTTRLAGELGRRGVGTPMALAHHDDGRVALSTVPGRSLHGMLRRVAPVDRRPGGEQPVDGGSARWVLVGGRPPGELADGELAVLAAIETVAGALAVLHDLPIPVGWGERVPDPPDRWVEVVARAEPAAAARLQQVAAALAPPPTTGPRALVHGDLHDKNVFVDESGDAVGLIDLDGVGAGWAEDDVADLAVHLELRALQAGLGSAIGHRWAAHLVAAYGAHRPLDEARLLAAARWTWFRLGCLYRFRPAGRTLSVELLRRALVSASGAEPGRFDAT